MVYEIPPFVARIAEQKPEWKRPGFHGTSSPLRNHATNTLLRRVKRHEVYSDVSAFTRVHQLTAKI